jgi:hypothetical protein
LALGRWIPGAARTTLHLAASEADDVRFGNQIRELDRIHERRLQRLEVGFRHPTGDAARASNKDWNLVLDFREQLGKRRKPDAVNVLRYRFFHQGHCLSTNAIVHGLSAPIAPTAVMKGSVALVGSSLACKATARILAICSSRRVSAPFR